MTENTSTPARWRRTVLGLTVGQWETVVLALALAAVLLITTLPPVLDSRSDDSASGGAGGTSAASASDQIPDTAQGVTDTSIKLGVVLLDLKPLDPLGLGVANYEVDIEQKQFDSLFDQINAAGGIDGRTIEPVYASRNPLATDGPHSDHAICVSLAKDEKVFAVIGFTYGAGECIASQYQLPVVTKVSALQQVYDDSHGLLVTMDPSLERDERDWANVLVSSGTIDDHKVGMLTVSDGGEIQIPAEAAADQLQKLGHPLTAIAEADPAVGAAGIPALVQKLKNAGADQVMLASDYLTALQFIAIAESQHYTPQYLTSDLEQLAADGLLANAGQSLNGAIGYTDSTSASAVRTETPGQQACRENYNDIPGVTPIPAGVQNPFDIICDVVNVFEKAATAAGKDLNPRSFIQGVEGLGSLDDITAVVPGSFGPGKTDYSDHLQLIRWDSAGKTYVPEGDPVPVDTP